MFIYFVQIYFYLVGYINFCNCEFKPSSLNSNEPNNINPFNNIPNKFQNPMHGNRLSYCKNKFPNRVIVN